MRVGLQIGWKLAGLRKNPNNILICPICNQTFKRRGVRKNGFKLVCCSRQCKAKSQLGKKIIGFNVKPKLGQIVTCKTCGKTFQHPPSRRANYCSTKCWSKDPSSFDAIRGSNNYHWKGGITPKNIMLRNSPESKAWTLSVFRRDGFKCRVCGIGGKLQAHHKFHWSNHPSNRLDLWNGITLCASCHRAIHRFGRIVNKWIEQVINEYDY